MLLDVNNETMRFFLSGNIVTTIIQLLDSLIKFSGWP